MCDTYAIRTENRALKNRDRGHYPAAVPHFRIFLRFWIKLLDFGHESVGNAGSSGHNVGLQRPGAKGQDTVSFHRKYAFLACSHPNVESAVTAEK